MPLVPLKDILDDAFAHRYGVAAFNIVDDATLDAVLRAASELEAPVIVQTSLKTVKVIGARVLHAMVAARAAEAPVPVTLHLDHCPDRAAITECLEAGWNGVLFDGSALPVAENTRQTVEVVAEARRFGAHVEGEIEGIRGVEDGVGTDEGGDQQELATALRFIRTTGVDCFAPAIGNAHGVYAAAPTLDVQRVSDIVAAEPIPIALHGGTGLTPAQFTDLIDRGCAKVNISTALKLAFVEGHAEFLREHPASRDPLALIGHVKHRVQAMAAEHITAFGSAGRAR